VVDEEPLRSKRCLILTIGLFLTHDVDDRLLGGFCKSTSEWQIELKEIQVYAKNNFF